MLKSNTLQYEFFENRTHVYSIFEDLCPVADADSYYSHTFGNNVTITSFPV